MPRRFAIAEATSLLPRLAEILLDTQARQRELDRLRRPPFSLRAFYQPSSDLWLAPTE